MDWTAFFNTILAAVLPILLGAGLLMLRNYLTDRRKRADASEIEKQIIDALLQGMDRAQEEIVRPAKSDVTAKLSKLEAQDARELATRVARTTLSQTAPKAAEALKQWSQQRIDSQIRQLVQKLKGGKP